MLSPALAHGSAKGIQLFRNLNGLSEVNRFRLVSWLLPAALKHDQLPVSPLYHRTPILSNPVSDISTRVRLDVGNYHANYHAYA